MYQSSEILITTVCNWRNSIHERFALWRHLLSLATFLAKPWMVMGDFNAFRWDSEKAGGPPPCSSSMLSFNNCIDAGALLEFPLPRAKFSWSNSSSGSSRIECKLDRALVNHSFLHAMPNICGAFLNRGLSDHNPILISDTTPSRTKSPFCFFNIWTREKDFFSIVHDAWVRPVVGTPMFRVVAKLKSGGNWSRGLLSKFKRPESTWLAFRLLWVKTPSCMVTIFFRLRKMRRLSWPSCWRLKKAWSSRRLGRNTWI